MFSLFLVGNPCLRWGIHAPNCQINENTFSFIKQESPVSPLQQWELELVSGTVDWDRPTVGIGEELNRVGRTSGTGHPYTEGCRPSLVAT